MISCVYCQGEHASAADVRDCWQRSEGGEAADRASSAPRPPDSTAQGGHDRRVAPPAAPPARPARRSKLAPIDQRGPAVLGRHALVAPGASSPHGWETSTRIDVDRVDAALSDPEPLVEVLRHAAQTAEGLVIELGERFCAHYFATQPPDVVERRPVHELGPGFTLWRDELHHLVFSNSFDARDGASPSSDVPEAWVDHGPVRFAEPVDGRPVVHVTSAEVGQPPPLDNSTDADLATDQLAAVCHAGGSARIIAPAGSGKTRVLTERARHLLQRWRLPASSVCLVAFNKRAQVEMRARTADLPDLQVRTLNSIALAIINGAAPFARQPRRLTTLDEPEVRRLLEQFVKLPRRLNVDPMSAWIDALSAVRLGMRDPNDVEVDYGGDVSGLAAVHAQYVAALERTGSVDFDHQIIRAIEVLLTQPDARRAAQAACRVMLVDEFQDLTPAHLLLVRLLAGPAGSVFGVGDDDQTIYGYNGADPAWLIEFDRWFPGSGNHPLEVNYRCPVGIVDAADRLLRHNRRRVAKAIRPAADAADGGWASDVGPDPVASTVAAVEAAIADGAAPADVAVLTRVNTTIAPVQVALNIAGLPVSGGVGTDYAERTAVRAAFAWLRLAESDVLSDRDVNEALRRPSRKLHPRVRDWVAEQRDVAAIRRLADRLNTDRDAANVNEFADDVERLQQLYRSGAGTSAILADLVDTIGLGTAVSTLDDGRRGTNRSAQSDDLQAFRQLAALYDRHGDGPFEPWLRGHLATRRSDDGVVLATVHRVKGQEWPHVVVHLADDDQFPHRLAENIEEERRLFHVALTRASQQATVVSGPTPSAFVDELSTEPPEHPPEPPSPRRNQPSPRRAERSADLHPLVDRSKVFAVVGITLVDQGQEWVVTDIEPAAVVAHRGVVERRFDLGEKVETVGRQRGKLSPRPGSIDATSALIYDRMRSYRDRVRDGKPAYTVFDDKTLVAIAEAAPSDERELLAVSGVGPAKLEQYGDDILELVADLMQKVSDAT